MTEEEAIQIATKEVVRRRAVVTQEPPKAIFKQRHMRLGKNRSGWLVVFRLDVPYGFEPDQLSIEVYEPDGEVHVPAIL